MDRKVYIEKLFSNRREKLIDRCIELQRQGKKFLYIMPSSAAIFQVRNKFIEANKGFLGSRVIVFDDLEMDITKNYIPVDRIIYEPIDRVIIAEICSRFKEDFKYYSSIHDKKGFHQEIAAFIRTLKRNCIDDEGLNKVMDCINDEVLKDKLYDLHLIFKEYNNVLGSNGMYDRNDISIKAVELADKYAELDKIDTIVIDGFTDIERVSLELIKEIAKKDCLNIYVNCPYENRLTQEFIEEEIRKPFEKMGFEILEEEGESYKVSSFIYELCTKFYSGERVSGDPGEINIAKYPCIEAEARETARSIKNRIINGEKPGEIAIYLNNKDAYSETMFKVFKEFNIPLSIKYELPLGDSQMVREIIKSFENNSEDSMSAEEWLEHLKTEANNKKEYMLELLKRTLNEGLDFVDAMEIKAFGALTNLIDETKLSFEKGSMLKDTMDRECFIEYMLESITSGSVTMEQGNNSGVRVMDTALAKGIYFDHIYVLGLNEGEIPSVIKNNGLFDNYDVSELRLQGIKYRDPVWELNRDKIRFNLALSSARKSITLSYRGADEEGKYSIASPFIDEIKYLCGIDNIDEHNMRARFELSFDDVMSDNELKSCYIKSYFENKYKGLDLAELKNKKGFLCSNSLDIEEIINNGTIEYHREMESDFNEYEGIMYEGFSNIADIICKFSPTAINTYLDCPFKYFASQLLQPGEPDVDDMELSNLEIGEFYHSVLYKYYSSARQFKCFDEELYEKVFNEAFSDIRKLDIDPEDMERKRVEMYNILNNFILADIERLQKFENAADGNILKPFILEGVVEDNTVFGVPVKCKIDRVDVEYRIEKNEMLPTGRYVVYDYKKKGINGINDILDNKDYQLPIYYFLIEKELKEKLNLDSLECMGLLYLSIEKTGTKIELDGLYITEYKKILGISKKGDINAANFPGLMNHIKGQILETLAIIKAGRFNTKLTCDNDNSYSGYRCEYEKLCRFSKNKMRRLVGEEL